MSSQLLTPSVNNASDYATYRLGCSRLAEFLGHQDADREVLIFYGEQEFLELQRFFPSNTSPLQMHDYLAYRTAVPVATTDLQNQMSFF